MQITKVNNIYTIAVKTEGKVVDWLLTQDLPVAQLATLAGPTKLLEEQKAFTKIVKGHHYCHGNIE